MSTKTAILMSILFVMISVALGEDPVKLSELESPTFSVKCFLIQNWNVYNLKGLQRPLKNKTDRFFNSTLAQAKVFYNFCDNVLQTCEQKSSLMNAFFNDGTCKNLAGPATIANKWRLINETDPASGLRIQLNPGSVQNQNSTVTWELKCDKNMTKGEITILNDFEFNPNSLNNTIRAVTRESCPTLDFYVVLSFLDKHSYIIGALLILIGTFLLLLGNKILKITIFVIACISTLVITFLFVYQFIIPAGSNPNVIWVVLGISVVLSIVVGYFMVKINLIFFIGLGALLGYIVGIIVYNLGFNRIEGNPKLIYWLVIVVCIIVFALLTAWLKKPLIIFATAIIGGYLFIKGVSLYAGGFPNESEVMDLISEGEWDEVDDMLTWKAYLYLAAWLILTILGIIAQFAINREKRVVLDHHHEDLRTNYYTKV